MHGTCLEFVQGRKVTETLGPLSAAGSFGMVYAKGLYLHLLINCAGDPNASWPNPSQGGNCRNVWLCVWTVASGTKVSVAKVVWAKYRGASVSQEAAKHKAFMFGI